MSDNNSFLSNYGNKQQEEAAAAPSKFKYEQKSGFKKPQSSGPKPPENKKRIKPAWIAGGAALIVLIVVLIIVFSGGGVQVIDLKGRTYTDAKLWADQNSVMLSKKEAYSDTVEEGKVIDQDVPVGQKVTRGGFLTLTVSLGHDLSVTVPLPDFKTMTSDEVKAWAAENFMTKVRVSAEYSADVPEGNVISYTVNDATVVSEVRRDSSIVVVVSKGPEEAAATIKVPDLKTKSLAECFTFAKANGLTLTIQEEFDDYVPAGTIMSQSVKADQLVSIGSEIVLVISKGKMITVPDFSAYTKEQATTLATEIGLPITVTEKYSSSSAGRLISQSIEAGSVYEKGDMVELKFSLGNKIVVASYVGQTRDAIETWVKGLNEQGAKITIKAAESKSSKPRGEIIFQDVANTSVGYKATINITVSAGKVVYVPDFVAEGATGYDQGITREKAIALCEAAGLIPVFVEDNTVNVLPGTVFSQSIAPGTETSEGTKITLLFKPTTTVIVPDFSGKDELWTRQYLGQLDIVFANGVKEGTVISQSLAVNSTVASGSVITLTMSGPPASP